MRTNAPPFGGSFRRVGRIAEFDYRVVNRDGELEAAVREVDAIIAAEKCRVEPRLVQFL